MADDKQQPRYDVDEGAIVEESARLHEVCAVGPLTYVGDESEVGEKAIIRANVTIEHHVSVGPFTIVDSGARISAGTRINRGAKIGANAVVLPNRVIGRHAKIVSGSVVHQDIQPFSIYTGDPARFDGFACLCGKTLWMPSWGKPFPTEPIYCEKCRRTVDVLDTRREE